MKKLLSKIILPAFILLISVSCQSVQPLVFEYGGEKAELKMDHPRLILTDKRFSELKSMYKKDTLLRRYVADVLRTVDEEYMDLPVLERDLAGKRDMLRVSRDELLRVYNLAFAFRWTGKQKYALEAKRHLLAVCEFQDWDPHHFLDVAEMTHAVSIGYDWLYDWLDDQTRDILRNAIIEKGCKEGITVYNAEKGFDKRVNNWNQVCNNSMIIGALAVAETDPEYLTTILPLALNSLPIAMTAFDPDGVCVEGPSYWHYAVRYCAYGFASMKSALGTDFGMSENFEGFRKTGYFPITMTGPVGYELAFSDCHMKVERSYLAPMFWLATRYDNPDFSESEHDLLTRKPAQVFHVMYYTPRVKDWSVKSDLDKYLRSKVEVACLRSGWDRNALFVGMKGGTTKVSHVHLDMGNYEMDALGHRWCLDLGSDSYSLPGFFDFKKQRWDYYRCVTRSHNLPVFNDKEQCLDSKVNFTSVNINNEKPFVVMDLQDAYRDQCSQMRRGISLVGGRKALLVQDEYVMEKPGKINWGFLTDAAIELDGSRAVLSLDDEKVVVRILAPAGAQFAVESAHQDPPQSANDGINRLCIKLAGQKENCISVLFSPVWEDGQVTETEVIPTKNW